MRFDLPHCIASGFYSGRSPKAPGTAGSLAAALIGAGLLALAPVLLWPACLAATTAGFWAVPRVATADEDPGWVVIDEFAGQFLAMTTLGHFTWQGVAAAFVLFRLFDIAKPGPIGWADRRAGPLAVMGDDVLAGVAGAAILVAVRAVWPGVLD